MGRFSKPVAVRLSAVQIGETLAKELDEKLLEAPGGRAGRTADIVAGCSAGTQDAKFPAALLLVTTTWRRRFLPMLSAW